MLNNKTSLEKFGSSQKKLNMSLAYDSAFVLQGIYPREVRAQVYTIPAHEYFFITVQICKQLTCTSASEGKKVWASICTRDQMEQTINTVDTSYSSKEHHAEKKRPVLEVNLTCV